MRKIIALLVVLAAGAVFAYQWIENSDRSEAELSAPSQALMPAGERIVAEQTEATQVPSIQSLGERVFAFGQSCVRWGVGSRAAYTKATALVDADFANSPLTPTEIRELKTEFAETMAARGEAEEAIALLQKIVFDEDQEIHSDLALGAVAQLGHKSKIRQAQADRYALLGDLFLETDRPIDAYESYKAGRENLAAIYGQEHPYLVFMFQSEIAAAEIARDQGANVEGMYCAKRRLANMQTRAIEGDFIDDEDVDAISVEHLAELERPICPELPRIAYDPEFEHIKVFYGTNRNLEKGKRRENKFGHKSAKLTVGTVDTTVPVGDKVGAYPVPGVFDASGAQNGVHVVLKKIDTAPSKSAFSQQLSDWSGQSQISQKEIFVYIHGHSEHFDNAARRAAQLAVELDMRHGAVMYSWPAGQRMTLYVKSQKMARQSARPLREFLELLTATDGIDRIHLIAHSMGNDVLTRALNNFDMEGYTAENRPFGQIIWAAPDVSTDDFAAYTTSYKNKNLSDGMTLYASDKDRALSVSNWLWKMRRAGQTPPVANVARVVPTVDTSFTFRNGVDFVGHWDYADGAVEDIKAILWLGLKPGARCFLGNSTIEDVAYWAAARGQCSEEAFRAALSVWRAKKYAERDPDFKLDETLALISRGVTPVDWETAEMLAQNLLIRTAR